MPESKCYLNILDVGEYAFGTCKAESAIVIATS